MAFAGDADDSDVEVVEAFDGFVQSHGSREAEGHGE
jgi:hypothetical protein